jgi:hypothetical protein
MLSKATMFHDYTKLSRMAHHSHGPTLNLKAVASSEMLVIIYQTTRRHIPKDGISYSWRRDNLKSQNSPQRLFILLPKQKLNAPLNKTELLRIGPLTELLQRVKIWNLYYMSY